VVGDNLWISVDNLLVKGGVTQTSFFHQKIPTGNTQRYTHKKVVKVERKSGLNCGFLTSPQLQPLVTTNSSIDIQQGVREPRVITVVLDKLGSQI
jgi:hypothetical protein